jgi:hypothetical protein
MSDERTDAPTVTSVVLHALRAADLPVSSLGVAQVADALLGAGCRVAGVQRADELTEQNELTRQASADADELERLRTATRQVGELADEWDRFGLAGPAQRLRNILGEVTS